MQKVVGSNPISRSVESPAGSGAFGSQTPSAARGCVDMFGFAVSELSIQERYFADTVCFGCGPKNDQGLRIRSLPVPDGDGVVATWEPQPHHVAAPGVLNGGIVGALLDCHSVAAVYAKTRGPGDHADGWWATAEYAVKLLRPTPSDAPLELHARVVELTDTEALTEARLESGGKLRATCTARFRRFVPR